MEAAQQIVAPGAATKAAVKEGEKDGEKEGEEEEGDEETTQTPKKEDTSQPLPPYPIHSGPHQTNLLPPSP